MSDLDERFSSFSRTRSPDLWPDISRREPSRPPVQPSRARRAAVAAVALLLAGAGLGLAALSFGSSREPATGTTGPLEPAPAQQQIPTTANVVETFEVGPDVRSVAYGEGSVWVAASNADGTFGGRVVRIDPETHEVQAEIPVDAIPTWEVGGGAMAFEDGDLWVAGDLEAPGAFDDPGGGADAAVIRIDTSTNEVVQTISVGGAGGADLTFLDGEMWVLVFGDEAVDHAMEVLRVSPQSGDVLARVTLSSGWAHSIVAADRHLVVFEGGHDAVNVDPRIAIIDPTTATLVSAEPPPKYTTPMPVAWRRQVWAWTEDGFAQLNPATGEMSDGSSDVDTSRSLASGFLEADDRGIWFVGFDGKTGEGGGLDLFDPETGEVTSLVALDEGSPVAMAIAPDSVWILNYEGTLTHVGLG